MATKKKKFKNITKGVVHILASFNNTMITIPPRAHWRHLPATTLEHRFLPSNPVLLHLWLQQLPARPQARD